MSPVRRPPHGAPPASPRPPPPAVPPSSPRASSPPPPPPEPIPSCALSVARLGTQSMRAGIEDDGKEECVSCLGLGCGYSALLGQGVTEECGVRCVVREK
eukprot:1173416-Rhodomonas_salina.1